MGQLRAPRECSAGASQPSLPAVCPRERRRLRTLDRIEPGNRPQPLPLGPRLFQRPRQRGERAPDGPAGDVVGIEDAPDVVPERARLARSALVGRRLADEIQPAGRTGARRVEEVAVAVDSPRAQQAPAQAPARRVVEERRLALAPRERSLLEPEHEDDLEAPRPRPRQVEYSHAAGLAGARTGHEGVLERRDHLLAGHLAAEPPPPVELVEQAMDRLEGTKIASRLLGRGRLAGRVRGGGHPARPLADGGDRVRIGAQSLHDPERAGPELLDLLGHALGLADRAAAQPALREVDLVAGQPGERRAQEGEQRSAVGAEPGEAEQGAERGAVNGARQSCPALERVGDAGGAERRLQRAGEAVDARADDGDRLGREAAAQQVEDLVRRQLERSARARALEEADRAADIDRRRRRVGEERALEMGERRVGDFVEARRQFLDPAVREPCEVLDRPLDGRERRSARLIGNRDRHVGAAGERLQQPPLGAGQVLEAVRVDGATLPGGEVAADPLSRARPQQVAVPEPRPIELRPVGREEPPQVSVDLPGLEQPGLELSERRQQHGSESGPLRRSAKPVQRYGGERPPDHEDALGVGRNRPGIGSAAGDLAEDVVERSDPAAEQRAGAAEQVALDPVDVRSVRHDQHRLAADVGQIAIQEQGDFSRVRGSREQRQRHRRQSTTVAGRLRSRARRKRAKSEKRFGRP